MPELPMQGAEPTLLDPEPAQARQALESALASGDPLASLRDVAARWPTCLDAWARLAEFALEAGDPVAAYAFARTGYHRGLDRARGAGWRGQGPVPSSHEPNQGFLRSVAALGRAAETIGEQPEARRCREFLGQLDPHGPFAA